MSEITTINKPKDFSKTYKKGKSFVAPVLVTYILKNYKKGIRLGITTSKKIGKAVYRNRARRVIKEAFRQLRPRLAGNFDIVFVARGRTPYVKMQDVRAKMAESLKKLGVLKDGAFDEKSLNKFSEVLPKKYIDNKATKV